jgi:hypothetical protein
MTIRIGQISILVVPSPWDRLTVTLKEVTKPMGIDQSTNQRRNAAPFFLQFRPRKGYHNEIWTVRLNGDLLTLMKPGDTCVMHLHREETARYLRFSYDLLRGRTITFHLIEGMKSFSFPCTKTQMLKLVAWMPHKEHSEIAKEVRVSGLAIVLFGVLHLLLSGDLWFGWGTALVVLGLSGICAPKRGLYGSNGALLLAAGLGDLVASSATKVTPGSALFDPSLIPMAVGLTLVVWGNHQLSMLGPNQLLRAARAIRDRRAQVAPVESKVVRQVALWNLVGGIGFGGCALLLWAYAKGSSDGPLLASAEWTPDLAVFTGLAVFSVLASAVLFMRARPAYFEAKVSAQMLLAVIILALWGFGASYMAERPLTAFGNTFSLDRAAYAPVAWVLLILWVSVFNRWYAQAVDRELEEQRD